MITWKDPIDHENDRIWYSSDDKYRITWRDHFMGVAVTPKYLACVHIEVNNKPMWDLLGRHNKLGPAQKTCAKHQKQEKQKTIPETPKRKKRIKRGAQFNYKPF